MGTRLQWLLLLLFLFQHSVFGETRMVRRAATGPYHVAVLHDDGRLLCETTSETEVRESGFRTRHRSYRERVDQVKVRRDLDAQRSLHSDWTVNFTGFPDEAKQAFLHAVYLWSGLIDSQVPIVVDARFEDFSGAGAVVVTSYSGPWLLEGASTLLPAALTDNQLGYDVEPGVADIEVSVRSSPSEFHFGLDTNPPPDKLDFVSIIIHELAHGLGFSSSLEVGQDRRGYYGYNFDPPEPGQPLPMIFDTFIRDARYVALTGDAPQLTDKTSFAHASTDLGQALTSNQLIFIGPVSASLTGWIRPLPLYAPDTYSRPSSFSHLDEIAFPPNDPDALLTPGISPGEAIHHPGRIVLAMLADIGWKVFFETHIPQFGAGSGLSSDIIVTNPSGTRAMEGEIAFFSPSGMLLDPADLIPETSTAYSLEPFGSLTFRTRSAGDLKSGSVRLLSSLPVSGLVRFNLAGTGVAGVGAGQTARRVAVPVRRKGKLSTGVAIQNLEAETIRVELFLRDSDGRAVVDGYAIRQIPPDGRLSEYIQELFRNADTDDFVGTLEIASLGGTFAAVGLELEVGRLFTTLPVTLVR